MYTDFCDSGKITTYAAEKILILNLFGRFSVSIYTDKFSRLRFQVYKLV